MTSPIIKFRQSAIYPPILFLCNQSPRSGKGTPNGKTTDAVLASICRTPTTICSAPAHLPPNGKRRHPLEANKLTNPVSIITAVTPFLRPRHRGPARLSTSSVVRRPLLPFPRRLDPNRPRLSCSSPCPCLAYTHRPSLRRPPPMIASNYGTEYGVRSTHIRMHHPAITRAMAQCDSIQVIVCRSPVLDPFVPSPSLTVSFPRPEPTDPTPTTILDGPRKLDQSGLVHLSIFSHGYGELSAPTRTTCSYPIVPVSFGIANKLARLHHTAPASAH